MSTLCLRLRENYCRSNLHVNVFQNLADFRTICRRPPSLIFNLRRVNPVTNCHAVVLLGLTHNTANAMSDPDNSTYCPKESLPIKA